MVRHSSLSDSGAIDIPPLGDRPHHLGQYMHCHIAWRDAHPHSLPEPRSRQAGASLDTILQDPPAANRILARHACPTRRAAPCVPLECAACPARSWLPRPATHAADARTLKRCRAPLQINSHCADWHHGCGRWQDHIRTRSRSRGCHCSHSPVLFHPLMHSNGQKDSLVL